MDSSQLAAVPLDPSETAVSFPPHRRRPLLSRTYRTLVGILSHCRTTAPAPQLQTQVDNDHSISRSMGERNGSTPNGMPCSTDLSVSLAHSKQSEDKFVQEIFIGENKENDSQQGNADKDAAGPLNHINSVPDSMEEVVPASTDNAGDVLMVENHTNGCGIQIANYQENVSNVNDIKMDDFGVLEQLEVDKELSVNDFSEILDSCLGEDNFEQSSDVIKGSQESGIVLEDNLYKGSENDLQLKEMELEKLIYSGGVEPTFCPNTGEDIEDGEISGEAGFADASFDTLSADVASQEERTTEVVHATQDDRDREKFISKNDISEYVVLAKSSLIETTTSNNNFKKVESRAAAGQIQDCSLQNATFGGNAGTHKSGSIGHCAESTTSVDKIIQESVADSDICNSSEKDKETENKKRKRGPGTKERRDKKKKKERIKRAEKNRELGVKRLKLPPVIKQKKIVYCRHYLHGRCHEGEKCVFSHDTVPLTKSKPCGHFARQACMKGDDCPYDHDLSKYPCKNYASNGFCGRGSGCLFSHEMPANSASVTPNVSKPDSSSVQHAQEGSFTASKNAKPDVKLPSQLNILNSSKPLNKFGCFNQRVDAKFGSAGSTPRTSTGTVPKTTGKAAPKGVSFLLNGRMSFGDSSRNKDDGSSSKIGNGVHVGCKSVEVPSSINKFNEMSERVLPSKPRGINFLSLAQPISDDPSSKTFSNLLSDVNNGKGKSILDDTGEDKVIGSLLQSVGTLQVNRLVNKSAVGLQQDVNKNNDRSPMAILRSINFSPFDKTGLDNSIFKKQANLSSAEGDREGVGSNLDDSIKLPSLSFSCPGNQLADGQISRSSSSSRGSCLPNTPRSVQNAVQSALAYAAKFEPAIKVRSSLHQGES